MLDSFDSIGVDASIAQEYSKSINSTTAFVVTIKWSGLSAANQVRFDIMMSNFADSLNPSTIPGLANGYLLATTEGEETFTTRNWLPASYLWFKLDPGTNTAGTIDFSTKQVYVDSNNFKA